MKRVKTCWGAEEIYLNFDRPKIYLHVQIHIIQEQLVLIVPTSKLQNHDMTRVVVVELLFWISCPSCHYTHVVSDSDESTGKRLYFLSSF